MILAPNAASTLLVVEYVNQGYTTAQSVAITTVGSSGYVAGALLSIMIADKFERKDQFVIAGVMMGITFILRGLLIEDYTALAVSGFIGFAANSWLTALPLYIYYREFSNSYSICGFRRIRGLR